MIPMIMVTNEYYLMEKLVKRMILLIMKNNSHSDNHDIDCDKLIIDTKINHN